MDVKLATDKDFDSWDTYVYSKTDGHPYLLSGWGQAIAQVYKHPVYYLMAVDSQQCIQGVLPLVHIKNVLFGNNLYSMPFADLGGVLSDNENIAAVLINKACEIAAEHGVSTFELRQIMPLDDVPQPLYAKQDKSFDKVRMLLDLPEISDQLMASFKAKLRSQIRRPLKDGLEVKSGGRELLNDFYRVFVENMRDLGSPVHAKNFIAAVLGKFKISRLFLVYKDDNPLACALVLGCRNTLYNPWASSLRRYSRMSPNMLLYWSMLEYACDNGFKRFDFGRSTPDEGTYKFKQQWGAVKHPLHWETFSQQGKLQNTGGTDQKSRFDVAMKIWSKMPVAMTRVLGPPLRKNIGL